MFRRRRFGDLIDRQLGLFERDNEVRLKRVEEARRRELEAGRDEAIEAYGDYLDEVGWAAEELRGLREGYARTLPDARTVRDYRQAFARAVRRRHPALADAFEHDPDLDHAPDED